MLSGLVPAVGAAAAPASAPPSSVRAADDPPPGNEGMPDDGFDNESEGEQDDFAGTGTGTGTAAASDSSSASAAPGVSALAAPVPGRAADFKLAKSTDVSGLVTKLDAALPKQGLTELMEQANRPSKWEGACGTAGIYGSDLAVNHRVCWQSDDATSSEWVPQAITGVSDAQEDEDWGTSNAEPIAVAGYDAENPGRSNYAKDRDNCLQDSASDDNGRLLQATPGTVDGTSQLVGNAKTLESAFGPEDLYLAHGRGDGFAPQLWSLSEHAPSKCGACKREVYSYNMGEVISDFG
ncbi:hypothetical protein OOK13_20460 [Streptomyces sp. NBC_00378]|uniref:hypothetical protein n=1 Tax=unclassified Streptomyces TaxID=2593676 RepID=UPI00224F0779|nr:MULTISPECIES: hypothetical protein [unclassified Streptomyces]MCX5110876.1 hypothetical protein [Streptomyces sp. NBC_00378]